MNNTLKLSRSSNISIDNEIKKDFIELTDNTDEELAVK
jgi:hypothetical protein